MLIKHLPSNYSLAKPYKMNKCDHIYHNNRLELKINAIQITLSFYTKMGPTRISF